MVYASQYLEGAEIAQSVVKKLLEKAMAGTSNSFMEVGVPCPKDKYHPPVYPDWIVNTGTTLQVQGVKMESVVNFTPEVNQANIRHLQKMLKIATETVIQAEQKVAEYEQKQKENFIAIFQSLGVI